MYLVNSLLWHLLQHLYIGSQKFDLKRGENLVQKLSGSFRWHRNLMHKTPTIINITQISRPIIYHTIKYFGIPVHLSGFDKICSISLYTVCVECFGRRNIFLKGTCGSSNGFLVSLNPRLMTLNFLLYSNSSFN